MEDLKILRSDPGFCRILRKSVLQGLSRKAKKRYKNNLKRNKDQVVPSPSSIFRYLSSFHNTSQEKLREPGKAFIPTPNKYLKGFSTVNSDFLSFVQMNNHESTATLDMDATIVSTSKSSALYSYKGDKSYQPLNTWWAEQRVIVHTEFRDGNVPAGYEQLRVLKEALSCLPSGVKTVRLRSDTAGYQHNLLRYCAQSENERFGKIEFAIGCNVTPAFKKAVREIAESEWKPLYKTQNGKIVKTETEWAEVCFVPNAIGHSKNGPEYRYIAKRTAFAKQEELPGIGPQQELPFPTMAIKKVYYKVFGIVTNMNLGGNELINWLHARCGNSEEAHSVMKGDLAGGKLPSNEFGENAAWWWIMILAMNLYAAMKKLALGGFWVNKRMKAIRFSLINLPARIIERSRTIFIRIKENHPSYDILLGIRMKILNLTPASGQT